MNITESSVWLLAQSSQGLKHCILGALLLEVALTVWTHVLVARPASGPKDRTLPASSVHTWSFCISYKR